MMETRKAHDRRVREGFYARFLSGKYGLDIGPQNDPITPGCVQWDRPNDAHDLTRFPDRTFDWVYSSHCLEHLEKPEQALREWWRVLSAGGYLIVVVPHRDLYEKSRAMPSRWNGEHKFYCLPDVDEPPCTFGLLPMVRRALGAGPVLIQLKTCDEGWTPSPPGVHSQGEYSIELVMRKP